MTEDQLEQETLGWLGEVGYRHLYGPAIAPDGENPERANYQQVLLPFHQGRSPYSPPGHHPVREWFAAGAVGVEEPGR